mgnify:FL=1
MLSLVTADPGLPRPNPTESYWQHIPHALADVQSSKLPTDRDFAIIGSGITGLSVARTLLECHPTATVTVLEARTLCSGATGRNGGQMAANAGEQYMHLAETHGVETAGKIVDFTFRNLEKMQELIEEYDAVELSEMQRLRKLRVFLTQGKFDDFKKSIARLEMDHPSKKGLYTILDADAVLKVSLVTHVVIECHSDLFLFRSMEFMEHLEEPCFLLEQSGHIVLSLKYSQHSRKDIQVA